MSRDERRRVSSTDVRNNARATTGKQSYFRLPSGIEDWTPRKAGTIEIDILPYEIKTDKHPDKHPPGTLWWKLPFQVHHNIGPNNESVVCPGSLGDPCPICQDRKKLEASWDENEAMIKALRAQRLCAYNIKVPDEPKKIAVFAYSNYCFGEPLGKELLEAKEEDLNFYDCNESGRTLRVRFSEEAFEGRKYLAASRFDFEPRKEMDEDEVLEKTCCLEECLNVMSYTDLKKLYLQIGGEDKKETDKPKDEEKPKSKEEPQKEEKTSSLKTQFAGLKKGDTVLWRDKKGKWAPAKVLSVDFDDEEVEIKKEDGNTEDVDFADLSYPEKTEQKKDEKPKAKKAEPKVGDEVHFKHKGEVLFGKITEKDDDDFTVEDKEGEEFVIDAGDIVEAPEEKKTEKPKAKKELAVGDRVEWDDGDEKGEVLKIDTEGQRAKIKNDDGDKEWVALKELKPLGER